MSRFSLFSKDYTEFLEGGIRKGVITGIYGPAGSGKTLTCMLACLSPDLDGKKVIYIDTERGFSIDRFNQLSVLSEKAVQDIIFFFPKDFDSLDKVSKDVGRIMNPKIGLIIVDTISSSYRLEVARKKDQKQLNLSFVSMTSVFSEIAKKFDIPIIFTSQVYSDMKNKGKVIPIGSFILKNRCRQLIELDKLENNVRRCTIMRNASLDENVLVDDIKGKSMNFRIINSGIESIDE
jgi:DNA repair protein RadB